jgi:hypothetical protein
MVEVTVVVIHNLFHNQHQVMKMEVKIMKEEKKKVVKKKKKKQKNKQKKKSFILI